MWNFLQNGLTVVSKRILLFVVLNWLFFGVMLVGAFLGQFGYGGFSVLPIGDDFLVAGKSEWSIMLLGIFFWNLVVSGFVLLTLSGLLFFVLPIVFLLLRAFLWGALFAGLPTPLFLAAFPTLVLEGEGYVLASVAGVNLGLSWLKPEWADKGEGLSRLGVLRKALKDCLRIYVLVAVLLFAAALVETLTIVVF